MSSDIGGYVRSDEKLVWKGRPQQGIRLYAQDAFMLPFGLLWGGGVVAVFGAGWREFSAAPLPFSLFPLIFLLAAAYITIGRLAHDAWIRSRIAYALTDRRVIILRRGGDLTTLEIGRISQIRFRPRGDRADIIFGPAPSMFSLFGARSFRASFSLWVPALSDTPQFIGVENGRRLFDQIEDARARMRSAARD